MLETPMDACSYWVVRYMPNLARDEWVNVGVLLLDPAEQRFGTRFIEEAREFVRIRRLHPNYDERLLRALDSHFQTTVAGADDPVASLAKLGETLSTAIQLSPERGLLTEDFEAELDRLYQQHVAPPPHSRRGENAYEIGRASIRLRLNELFRRAGLAGRLERGVRVDELTFKGDPLRLDFAYRRNGTRGFVQALSLNRDVAQAKALAYTAGLVRKRLGSAEFTVVSESASSPDNERDQFVVRLLGNEQINLVPVTQLEPWVDRLRSELLQ